MFISVAMSIHNVFVLIEVKYGFFFTENMCACVFHQSPHYHLLSKKKRKPSKKDKISIKNNPQHNFFNWQ